jgi:putative peptidoglycan lipid II flippase
MKKINVVRTFSFMFAAVMLTKVLGLLRNIIFASAYGNPAAFLAAQNIPLTLFDISLGAAVTSAFIPVFTKSMEKEGHDNAMSFANSFINLAIIVSGALTLIGILFAPYIVKLMSPGLEPENIALATQYVRVLFPIIIFTTVTFVFIGILQSLNQFKIPSIVSLFSSTVLILYLIIFNNKFGMNGYIAVMLFAWSLQVVIQLPSIIKSGYKYSFNISFKDGKLKKVGLLMLPILFSTWEQPINTLINQNLGSYFKTGITSLYFANTFYLIVAGSFSMVIVNLIFPSLSRSSLLEDKTQFKDTIRKAIRITIYIIFPLMIGFIILAQDIITMVYQRGKFDSVLSHDTSTALMFYSIGMIGFGIQEICRKAFYSSDNAKIPMKIAWLTITINVVLSIMLSRTMGIGGIALAASIASTLGAILQLVMLDKINKGIISPQFLKDMFKIIIISVIMGAIIYFLRGSLININLRSMFVSKFILVGICGMTGMIVYFGLTSIFKVEEAVLGLKMIKTKLKFR